MSFKVKFMSAFSEKLCPATPGLIGSSFLWVPTAPTVWMIQAYAALCCFSLISCVLIDSPKSQEPILSLPPNSRTLAWGWTNPRTLVFTQVRSLWKPALYIYVNVWIILLIPFCRWLGFLNSLTTSMFFATWSLFLLTFPAFSIAFLKEWYSGELVKNVDFWAFL